MPSRRNYLTITLIMLVLLFLFQATNVMKERWNRYDENQHIDTQKKVLSGTERYKSRRSDAVVDSPAVIYIGVSLKEGIGKTVQQWCAYRKYDLLQYASPKEVPMEGLADPIVVLVDSDCVDFGNDTQIFWNWTEQGVSIIFCSLPQAQVIDGNAQLRTLLGISEVRSSEVKLDGINLFDGFLFGGRTIYEAKDEKEEEELQDMELNVPWYRLSYGTKSYMNGRLELTEYEREEEELKNEDLPALVWRCSVNSAMIFAVNGSYMEDVTGLGMLDAMLYEMREYTLYPVVNAQNFVIANLAGFTSEQDEQMNMLYSRSQIAVFQDLIWPSITSIYLRTEDKPTVFLSPTSDYTQEYEPDKEKLVYYLKLFREADGETGLSLSQHSDIRLTHKINADAAFFEEAVPDYQMTSLYVDAKNEENYRSIRQARCLESVRTLQYDLDTESSPVGYASGTVTYQRATQNGYSHTYSDNLRLKSLETCLGYSNIIIDLDQMLYPRSEEDVWEKLSEKLASNVITYWKPFKKFEKTTLSESDMRIRQFLNLTYEESREADVITLKTKSLDEHAFFILRTHNEVIREMEGGVFQELETYAYLIEITEEEASITLEKDEEAYSVKEE